MICAYCKKPLALIKRVIDGEEYETWEVCRYCPHQPHEPWPYIWHGVVYPGGT